MDVISCTDMKMLLAYKRLCIREVSATLFKVALIFVFVCVPAFISQASDKNIGVTLVDSVSGGKSMTEMLSSGQVMIVNAGETVRLDCEFQAYTFFNLFDNPVWWHKAQQHEETQINMMANILEPFKFTSRFRVAFQSRDPNYKLSLFISELSLEDSGNYTCEVNGPFNSLLGSVTHYLFVRAAVTEISLLTHNGSVIHSATPFNHQQSTFSSLSQIPGIATGGIRMTDSCFGEKNETNIVFVEKIPGVLRCIAKGGYPSPDVQLFVGRREVTIDFGLTHITQLIGSRGLRVINHVTERWSQRFIVDAADDGSRITCVVSVTGLTTTVCSRQLNVYHAPVVECDPRWAQVGDRNVFLRCKVKAKPRVTAFFWILDANGTTVTEGQVVADHWTLVLDYSDGTFLAQLYIRQVKSHHFRRYTLVVENSVSARSQDVMLRPKNSEALVERHRQPTNSTKSQSSSSHFANSAEYLYVNERLDTFNLALFISTSLSIVRVFENLLSV